jgi:hypothetical protein
MNLDKRILYAKALSTVSIGTSAEKHLSVPEFIECTLDGTIGTPTRMGDGMYRRIETAQMRQETLQVDVARML